ncbi:ABC transporter permease [Aminipila luticellarii]|uniref:Transport permease protein n=1 Tax=Aminipila luticellarii TaxID=2507160 RepID=A0A410PYJ9_9FIRM|nr:ABC transporter permease [Aminipila luticellarii]
MNLMFQKLKKHQFLFEELVKRDFTKKYKRTVLGMAWSILSPLLNLLIMWMVFNTFFGNNVNHYVIYLFAGQLVFSYFGDATSMGMNSLLGNSAIFTKINIPKYLFLFSQNISSLINFGLTLVIFFIFVAAEGLPFTWKFLLLFYPIVCLVIFNTGLGLILSAMQVFFRDMQYLWGILTQLIMWMSAIFYTIDNYSYTVQCAFLLNPVYLYIRYFRKIVIDSDIPTPQFHLLAAAYALIAFGVGCWMYKKYNHEFLYYV